jgi:hypothetical protein
MHKASTYALGAALLTALSLPIVAQEYSHSHRDENGREIVHHRVNGELNTFGMAPTSGSTSALSSSNRLKYWGGPVIATPTIYIIWYGNWNRGNGTDVPSGQQIVRDFFSAIGGSPYFMINSHYVGGSTSISGHVTWTGKETTVGYTHGTSLPDATFATIVAEAINSGALPKDTNGLYFVLTSSDVTASSGFCSQYCGWHTNDTINGSNLRYAFVGNAARCITSCAAQSTGPNGNAGVDGMISVVAHELEEAVTDPDGTGWLNNAKTKENGDDCAWTFGSTSVASNGAYYNMTLGTRKFLIQRNVDFRSTGGQYCDLTHR